MQRTMAIILLSLWCVWYSLGAPPPSPPVQADAAVAQVRQALALWKATVQVDPQLPEQAPLLVRFESANDAALKTLAQYPVVGAVQIVDARLCTAQGYAALKAIPHLRKLAVEHAALTPLSVAAIAQCSQLRHLALMDAGLNDACLAALKPLRRLEHLNLNNNPKITDQGLKALAALEQLRSLHLAHARLSDKGLQELKALEGLRTLNVAQTSVTQEALEQLADAMPNLRNIRR